MRLKIIHFIFHFLYNGLLLQSITVKNGSKFLWNPNFWKAQIFECTKFMYLNLITDMPNIDSEISQPITPQPLPNLHEKRLNWLEIKNFESREFQARCDNHFENRCSFWLGSQCRQQLKFKKTVAAFSMKFPGLKFYHL